MEDVFRFLMIRPPEKKLETNSINLDQETDFIQKLKKNRLSDNAYQEILETSEKFIKSEYYINDINQLNYGRAMLDLINIFEGQELISDLEAEVHNLFGLSAQALLEDSDFCQDIRNTKDSIIAIEILHKEHTKPLYELSRIIQASAIIKRTADADNSLANLEDRIKALNTVLLLPPEIFPLPQKIFTQKPGIPPIQDKDKEFNKYKEKADKLRSTLYELNRISPDKIAVAGLSDTITRKSNKKQYNGIIQKSLRSIGLFSKKTPQSTSNSPIMRTTHISYSLNEMGKSSLSETTKKTLDTMNLDPEKISLQYIMQDLDAELLQCSEMMSIFSKKLREKNVVIIGDTPLWFPQLHFPVESANIQGIPKTHGNIRPAGVADLLVVKQKLIRYEAEEIAHIENILKGESKNREHRRQRNIEEFVSTEIEQSNEEERDLQSTERFELQRETSEVIKEEASLKAGVSISGSYGSIIQFKAYADGAIQKSKEESVKTASQYSKEITSRSTIKVSERVREQRSLRIAEEFEEINQHSFDNTQGADHIKGIYQWVNKVYLAQIYNYGLRTMYDLTVPEPAAFFIEALKQNLAENSGLEKPEEFTLKANEINEYNYHEYIKKYNVEGVSPLPERCITLSKAFYGGPDDPESTAPGCFVQSAEISIPDGYMAVFGYGINLFNPWDSTGNTEVSIGIACQRFTGSPCWWGEKLNSERSSIPVSVKTYNTATYAVTIEITCLRTFRALEKWRLQAHSAILQAYQNQKAKYEEKLAELAIQEGVEITGDNPISNKKSISNELKKMCVSLITGQHFDLFGAIENDSNDYPQIDIEEAELEGAYIRFIEQAFEWENMTYVFYPYYWSRKKEWIDKIFYKDTDPLFVDFLKAGAARIVIPGRSGFENAIDHFMNTGEPWMGGELPDITSESYLPIIEEIKEQLGAPGEEIPVGEPWEVVVPTSLVLLRQDSSLPKWQKDENNKWIPV